MPARTSLSATGISRTPVEASGWLACVRCTERDGTRTDIERYPGNFHAQQRPKKKEDTMNKDRIEGSAEQAKGKVKEVAGKAMGDSKLENEGKADQVAGKVQNTVGGIKDAVKEAVND